jgi:hypothetical protein
MSNKPQIVYFDHLIKGPDQITSVKSIKSEERGTMLTRRCKTTGAL